MPPTPRETTARSGWARGMGANACMEVAACGRGVQTLGSPLRGEALPWASHANGEHVSCPRGVREGPSGQAHS